MRASFFAALLVVVACTPHGSTVSRHPHSSDLEVYRAVLDSMFTPHAQSNFSRIAVADSTEVFKRENASALIQSLVKVPEVDSAAARDFATRSYEARSLKGIAALGLRMPVLLLDRGAPIDAGSPNGSTALMMAAQYGSEASVDLLLSRGADAKIKNDRGLTAGDFARLAKRDALAARLDRGGR